MGITDSDSDSEKREKILIKDEVKNKRKVSKRQWLRGLICTLRVGEDGPQGPSPLKEISFVRPKDQMSGKVHPFLMWRQKKRMFGF